jgi:SGNH hydrolase-like domain, acetyltransferase AlgX
MDASPSPTALSEPAPGTAPDRRWYAWREPREVAGTFETPYHHPLIELRIDGEVRSQVMSPLDLPRSVAPEAVSWRPPPWATAGQSRWSGKLDQDTIFEGEDGHLFHTINAVCEQLFEPGWLSPRACAAWVDVLRRRLDWCAARGIAFRQLVVPEHHVVYPDKLPGHPTPSPTRPILRIMAAADEPLQRAIVYPLQAMRDGRSRHETSFPHDVHFTSYGAFLCYQALMRSLPAHDPEQLVREEALTPHSVLFAGDLAHPFGRSGRQMDCFVPPLVKLTKLVKGTSFKSGQVDVFETPHRDSPRLVIFRTSNSTQLFPFLAHHFSRITAVGAGRVFFDLIESEAPHIVVSEIPERYIAPGAPLGTPDYDLAGLPDDDSATGFVETTGHMLPLPGGVS